MASLARKTTPRMAELLLGLCSYILIRYIYPRPMLEHFHSWTASSWHFTGLYFFYSRMNLHPFDCTSAYLENYLSNCHYYACCFADQLLDPRISRCWCQRSLRKRFGHFCRRWKVWLAIWWFRPTRMLASASCGLEDRARGWCGCGISHLLRIHQLWWALELAC